MIRTAVTDFFTGQGKSMAYVGAALALTGVGTATAAVATSSASPASPAASSAAPAAHASVGDQADGTAAHGSSVSAGHVRDAAAVKAPARTAKAGSAKSAPAKHAKPAEHAKPAKAAPHHTRRVHVVRHAAHHAAKPMTWKQVRDALAKQTYPKAAPHRLPLFDRVNVGSPSGPQAYMPVTDSRMANATTIVREALHKHMGLRAAVIAVATSMQEATLENLNYGDRDSLGLFQQRPSAGWGTPQEITNPAYAADAFLNALHTHQQADPEWASQPLWATAQAVQNSGFPYAYAKWEAQAAQLVTSIAQHMA